MGHLFQIYFFWLSPSPWSRLFLWGLGSTEPLFFEGLRS